MDVAVNERVDVKKLRIGCLFFVKDDNNDAVNIEINRFK